MDKTEKYENALRRIGFMALKRKMLKRPPSIEEFIKLHNFTAAEVWEILELVGKTALTALKEE